MISRPLLQDSQLHLFGSTRMCSKRTFAKKLINALNSLGEKANMHIASLIPAAPSSKVPYCFLSSLAQGVTHIFTCSIFPDGSPITLTCRCANPLRKLIITFSLLNGLGADFGSVESWVIMIPRSFNQFTTFFSISRHHDA